jgi:hypothetical protein
MSEWLKAHGARLTAKCSERGFPVFNLAPCALSLWPFTLYLTPYTFCHLIYASTLNNSHNVLLTLNMNLPNL